MNYSRWVFLFSFCSLYIYCHLISRSHSNTLSATHFVASLFSSLHNFIPRSSNFMLFMYYFFSSSFWVSRHTHNTNMSFSLFRLCLRFIMAIYYWNFFEIYFFVGRFLFSLTRIYLMIVVLPCCCCCFSFTFVFFLLDLIFHEENVWVNFLFHPTNDFQTANYFMNIVAWPGMYFSLQLFFSTFSL